jgi:hypothetical protein
MIDAETLFNEIKDALAISVPDAADNGDLARAAGIAIERSAAMISVHPSAAGPLWAWLERSPVKIIARFAFVPDMCGLSADINAAFKKGAAGAQISVSKASLAQMAPDMAAVRDDLFFNKDLLISVNLGDIGPYDWADLFANIEKIKAAALVFDASGKKQPDFVGKVYRLLEYVADDFEPDFCFVLGNDYEKVEQAWRLFEKMRPNFLRKLKFFIRV